MNDAAVSSDLFHMYEHDIFAGFDFEAQYAADLLGPYGYDYTVQQDLDPGDNDGIPSIDGSKTTELLHDLAFIDKSERHFDHAAAAAGTIDMPSPRCQKRDTIAAANAVQVSVVDLCGTDDDVAAVDNTVVGCMVPPDSLSIFPHDINAFNTGDCCPQVEVDEGISEFTSAEFQRLVAANAAAGAMKVPSARGQKRRQDTADVDIDAGGARGASLAQQLDPAVKDDGSRQGHAPADREPNAATSLVSCRGKRDAATQVSEALLLQEFGSVTPTRDVSTQVCEDDLRNDGDSFEPTTAPELLPAMANGVYEDELPLPLPFDCSADFTEYATIPLQFEDYTVPMDQDFVGFFDFNCEQCY